MPLLNVKVPNASADVVAIFDENFNQVFENGRPIKAMVNEDSKVMEHPVETGATITDHSIILPVEIELSLILDSENYRNTYQQIKTLFKSRKLLTVQTKTDSYRNMLIQKIPHDEDPELFDVIAIAVSLKEVLFVTAQFGTLPASKVANKSNASTVQKGEQQAKTASPSLLRSAAQPVADWFKYDPASN